MIGGSVVIGGGTYLWLRASRSVGALPAGTIATGVTAALAGAALYYTDQDPGRSAPPVIRDTATIGMIVYSSGVALTGVGLWLWHREKARPRSQVLTSRLHPQRSTSAPVVVVDASRVLVGWSGRFQ
jgi:hypothetical protein